MSHLAAQMDSDGLSWTVGEELEVRRSLPMVFFDGVVWPAMITEDTLHPLRALLAGSNEAQPNDPSKHLSLSMHSERDVTLVLDESPKSAQPWSVPSKAALAGRVTGTAASSRDGHGPASSLGVSPGHPTS
jgi:hypothetical protein